MSAVARTRLPSLSGYKYQSNTTKQRRQPPPPPPKVTKRTYHCCPTPNVNTLENETICYCCGKVIIESNIVSEVTFGETSGGAAVVEGGFIHANQRHANSMGGSMRGLGGMESREQAALVGKNAIEALANALSVRDSVRDQAIGWYKLATNYRFIQGRRMRNVAAVAIYMAARRQPENTLLLIDLAEKIQTNVWTLGDTYKSFLKMLNEEDPAHLAGSKTVQEIEPLMLKYCRKLEFGDDSHRVADDACKVLKRMSRDWMVQGRQPAGLCGACIVIAARMNNFRRTIREVVYVVKVADSTITSRLFEYKRTQSAALTVNQFREFGQRLKVTADPPAIWRRAEKEERKEKRIKRMKRLLDGTEIEEDAEEGEEGDSGAEAGPSTAPTRASKRRKSNDGSSQAVPPQPTPPETQENPPSAAGADALDGLSQAVAAQITSSETQENASSVPGPDALNNSSQVFAVQITPPETQETAPEEGALDGNAEAVIESAAAAVEEVEAGEAADPDFVMPKKKRGRPAKKKRTPIVVAEEDLEIENDIEDELRDTIKDWESIFKDMATNEDHEILRRTGWTAAAMARAAADTRDNVPVNDDPEIGEDEFENDPDVATCILAPEEVRRKEAIWITENEEWLRAQQEKMLLAELEAAEDKPKKQKQKRKHHQMGDGSVLEGQPATSAADAVQKMIKKRAPAFSNHINYDRLKELFPGGAPSAGSSSKGASPATRSPPVVRGVTEEDAEGEEEEQQEAEEEEEDLENEHMMEDEDEGFGNASYEGWP